MSEHVAEALDKIYQQYQKLPTVQGEIANGYLSQNFVPGTGSLRPLVMLIGEAPGRNEDKLGKPFVGAAGKVLDDLLAAVGLDRAGECWVTNTVKYRPVWTYPSDRTGQLVVRNRTPDTYEVEAARPYLAQEVKLLAPRVIVPLGATALRCVDSGPAKNRLARGQFTQLHGWRWYPTYHPAAVLYGRGRQGKIYQAMLADFTKIAEVARGA